MIARYKGRTYDIPDLWVAGFMQGHPGLTFEEVVAWWHEQTLLGEAEEAARWETPLPKGTLICPTKGCKQAADVLLDKRWTCLDHMESRKV
jgi:hypothetical protein